MDAPPSTHLEVRGRLDGTTVEAVSDLLDRATAVDGVRPLDEHATLHLHQGGDDQVRHVLAWDDQSALVGYLHLDVTDVVAGSSAQLVVDPEARRGGIGRALVEQAAELSPDGRLRLWSRGRGAPAGRLAESLGFTMSRVLWQMRRDLGQPLPEVVLPADVVLRSFSPGVDDERWVAVNAEAFAGHPDQGRWTLDDLHARMAEGWFEPHGFLLAVPVDDHADILGFHWTKVHGSKHSHDHDASHHSGDEAPHHHPHDHAHDLIGEVYIVGVHPGARGLGLGRALTLAGLHYLQTQAVPEAMLYVDEANSAALALYESLGFTRYDVDVQYRR